MERNMLFAPNYLISKEELDKAIRYVFGGHSILVIEETPSGKGLYFERCCTSKSNKFISETNNQIHIGFQSIMGKHYVMFGLRQDLSALSPKDLITLNFKNGENLELNLEAHSENFGKPKNYACNLRAEITMEEVELFKTRLVHEYTAKTNTGKEISKAELDKDFSRKLRELAQTYAFCLKHYY